MEGRFVEQQEISQIVESPLGERSVYERTEFREFGFKSAPGGLGLEVINPPRSLSLFLSRLAEACDFQVAITEINVDVMSWCERLAFELDRRVDIVSCQLRNIKVAESVYATAVLKGSVDVRAAANLFTRGAPYTNDKIKVQIEGPPFFSLVLTRHSAVALDQNAPDYLLTSLRGSLLSSLT
ncbi:MAG: hypothetical protein E5Y67_07095 [Mesorhizobium sp.]|nr:MAG: hypothetical protein E5Y67_07095 [Mesorhizobium sp.]